MANDGKYLTIEGGLPKQELGASAGGAGDANKVPKLDASGKLPNAMMPVGIGADSKSVTTSEVLAAGDLVNIHNSAGEKVRKADATVAGKEAHGFVLAAAAAATAAIVFFEGTITGLAALTPGARQFLGTAAGGRTEAPPAAAGNVAQLVGVAISATELSFEPQLPFTLA